MTNNVTKLISGVPEYEEPTFKLYGKARPNSRDLVYIDLCRPDCEIVPKLIKVEENKNFPHFYPESTSCTTPDGHIFSLGGRTKATFHASCKEFKPIKRDHPRPHQGEFKTEIILRRDMLNARAQMGITCTNKDIFVVGGYNSKESLKDCEMYDIKKDIWRKLPVLNMGRHAASACLFRSRKLYVFGGIWGVDTVGNIEHIDIREGK